MKNLLALYISRSGKFKTKKAWQWQKLLGKIWKPVLLPNSKHCLKFCENKYNHQLQEIIIFLLSTSHCNNIDLIVPNLLKIPQTLSTLFLEYNYCRTNLCLLFIMLSILFLLCLFLWAISAVGKKKLNLIICNGGFSSFNSCTNWLKFMPAFVCKNLLLYLWL